MSEQPEPQGEQEPESLENPHSDELDVEGPNESAPGHVFPPEDDAPADEDEG